MNSRERMIAACRGLEVDRPPVWMMRQAGRYLPEYRELRRQYTFQDMLRFPEVAVEASLQPLRRFPLDAAIVFSDILIALEALGVEVDFETGGPVIRDPVRQASDLRRLTAPRMENGAANIAEAVRLLGERLHPETAVIGFAGAPFTLASYLVEGRTSRDGRTLKALAYRDPGLVGEILERLAETVAELLLLQVRAGADLVQIFDTWAGLLSPEDYESLALPYVRRVRERLAGCGVPVILYLRNAAGHLEAAASSGCDVLSLDSSLRLAEARRRLGPEVALQGNLDPAVLMGPADEVRRRVLEMIRATGGRGHVVNLGQGLAPEIPVAGVEAFVAAVTGGAAGEEGGAVGEPAAGRVRS